MTLLELPAPVGAIGWDGTRHPSDIDLLSASSVGGVLANEALTRWSVTETAKHVVANASWLASTVAAGHADTARSWVESARFGDGKTLGAAATGTLLHTVLESRLRDEPIPDEVAATVNADPVIAAMARQLDAWLSVARPEALAMEQVVFDPVHRLAGRFDAVVRLRGRADLGSVLVDLKTTREHRTGGGRPKRPYGDKHALQLAVYRYASLRATFEPRVLGKDHDGPRFYLLNPAEAAACVPAGQIDATAILHLTPEACALYPVDTGPAVHADAVTAARLHGWLFDRSRRVIGAPIDFTTPPLLGGPTIPGGNL